MPEQLTNEQRKSLLGSATNFIEGGGLVGNLDPGLVSGMSGTTSSTSAPPMSSNPNLTTDWTPSGPVVYNDGKQTISKALQANMGNLGAQLGADEAQYMQIPQTLNTDYTANAKNSGSWANTPQFQSGLNSAVEAGAQGAIIDNLTRQQALRSSLGLPPLPPNETGTSTNGQLVMQALQSGGGLPNPDPTGPIQPTSGTAPQSNLTINTPTSTPTVGTVPGQALPTTGTSTSPGVNPLDALTATNNAVSGSGKNALDFSNQSRQQALAERKKSSVG